MIETYTCYHTQNQGKDCCEKRMWIYRYPLIMFDEALLNIPTDSLTTMVRYSPSMIQDDLYRDARAHRSDWSGGTVLIGSILLGKASSTVILVCQRPSVQRKDRSATVVWYPPSMPKKTSQLKESLPCRHKKFRSKKGSLSRCGLVSPVNAQRNWSQIIDLPCLAA
jgi:hypothetical protein